MSSPAGGPGPTPGGGWVPVPDPTTLTNEAFEKAAENYRRELWQLREVMEARMRAGEETYQAHLEDMGQLRKQLEEKISHLGELCDVRFDGIDRRFEDRDDRLEVHNLNGEKALLAALESAQKISEQHDRYNEDAIDKAQLAINEKIRSLELVASTSRGALEDKIDDARTRVTMIESLTRGISENRTDSRLNNGQLVAVIVGILVGVGVIVSVITLIVHK